MTFEEFLTDFVTFFSTLHKNPAFWLWLLTLVAAYFHIGQLEKQWDAEKRRLVDEIGALKIKLGKLTGNWDF